MSPTVLVFNAGSSSLKFCLFSKHDFKVVLRGEVESVFHTPLFWLQESGKKRQFDKTLAPGFQNVIPSVFEAIQSVAGNAEVTAIGHRVLHGGKVYREPIIVNNDVLHKLKSFIPLAPLHQPHNIEVIELLMAHYNNIPHVACFDTAFHRTQDKLAELFPLPQRFMDEGVIRYGFHGLSYEYIASKLPSYAGDKANQKIVVAHLGNGASMCAMRGLKSVATTMGFTALDGLMMGTRCGNIDPGVTLYLLKEREFSYGMVMDLLYNQSGLKGVSGITHDMSELLKCDDPKAKLAIDLFCYIAARQLCSLLPTISGIDCLVFTAGIGENCPEIRKLICSHFEWLEIDLDDNLNKTNSSKISSTKSRVEVFVIPTNEELMIARHTVNIISLKENKQTYLPIF